MLNNKILLELAFLKEHLFVLLGMCIGRTAHQAGLWMGAGRGDTYCIHHGPSWVWLGWGGWRCSALYLFTPGCRGCSYLEKWHLMEMAEHAQSHKCFSAFDHILSLSIDAPKANTKEIKPVSPKGNQP